MGEGRARTADAANEDRAVLEAVLTTYLGAVVAHDPSVAPLAEGYRQTENAMAVPVGKGVWQTMTGVGALQCRFVDPVNGGVGLYGSMRERDEALLVTLRLQTEGGLITEAEWYLARGNDPDAPPPSPGVPNFLSVEGAETTPPPGAPHGRATRRVMIAAANSYFDALQSGDEDLMAAQPNWLRLENGFGTGRSPGGARIGRPGVYPGKQPDESTMGVPPGGTENLIRNVTARRYPIVDEDAGVLLALVIFERPPGSPMARNLLSEWFTFDGGKITGIYAVMSFLDASTPAPNWAPYDSHLPLPATTAVDPDPGAASPFVFAPTPDGAPGD